MAYIDYMIELNRLLTEMHKSMKAENYDVAEQMIAQATYTVNHLRNIIHDLNMKED